MGAGVVGPCSNACVLCYKRAGYIHTHADPCEVYDAVHMPRRVLFTAQAPPRTPAGYIAGHRAGNILRPIHKPHST